jgi:putative DNA primase/helicase
MIAPASAIPVAPPIRQKLPTPSSPDQRETANAYMRRVAELAAWALSWANRLDRWGGYKAFDNRGEDGDQKVTTRPWGDKIGVELLTDRRLQRHFSATYPTEIVGLHSTNCLANTSKWVQIDVDAHGDESPDVNLAAALHWYGKLVKLGMGVLLVTSNGVGGFHLWVFFSEPIPTERAYQFGQWIVEDFAIFKRVDGSQAFARAPETFPKQPYVAPDKYGNWVRLPGPHHTKSHWSTVWNGTEFVGGDPAIDIILSNTGNSPSLIPHLPAPAPEKQASEPRESERAAGGNRMTDAEIAEACIAKIPNSATLHYDDHLSIGAAIHHATSGSAAGFNLFDRWSSDSSKYKSATTANIWKWFSDGGSKQRTATVATLIKLARDNGFEPFPQKAKAADGKDGLVALGGRDPKTGKLVLSPKRTLPTADAYLEEFHSHADGRTLHAYGGLLLAWRGNRYCEVEDDALRQRLLPWLHDSLRYFQHKDGSMELIPFDANPNTVKAALESVKARAYLPITIQPPAWLGVASELKATDLLATPSGNLHVPTGTLYPPTPRLFNVSAIDFDYVAKTEPPERWIKFLEQLWGDDLESVELLQEFMGYALVGDTSQQKMLLIVGPKRSGKGTTGRVLTRLVGAGNVVGPTTSSLAGNFGLQPLIGKSLAIVSDARFSGDNIAIVTERLLCISGEDNLTIDRKFLGSVSMKLALRFIFFSNELPRINDAAGALAGRFMVLRLTKSFYGEEDPLLTERLLEELPGILAWAIEGLKRLRQRGHFVQPQSVRHAIQELEDLSSPVGAFVRDWCSVRAGARVTVASLFEAWGMWCQEQGRDHPGTTAIFGRDLRAVAPSIEVKQQGTGLDRSRIYEGIDLTLVAKQVISAARAAKEDQKRGANARY